MNFRVLLSSVLAVAVLGLSAEGQAAEYGSGYRPKVRYHHSRAPYRYRRSYAYRDGIGGQLFGYQHTPFSYSTGNNYPGYQNNQSFWERVQTQGQYPVQY